MSRHRLTSCLVLLALALPSSIFAQSPSSIRITDQRTPDVKPIPVSPSTSSHAVRTVQFQAAAAGENGSPQIPDILTGRKSGQTAPATKPLVTQPPANQPAATQSANALATQVQQAAAAQASDTQANAPATQPPAMQPPTTQAPAGVSVAQLPGGPATSVLSTQITNKAANETQNQASDSVQQQIQTRVETKTTQQFKSSVSNQPAMIPARGAGDFRAAQNGVNNFGQSTFAQRGAVTQNTQATNSATAQATTQSNTAPSSQFAPRKRPAPNSFTPPSAPSANPQFSVAPPATQETYSNSMRTETRTTEQYETEAPASDNFTVQESIVGGIARGGNSYETRHENRETVAVNGNLNKQLNTAQKTQSRSQEIALPVRQSMNRNTVNNYSPAHEIDARQAAQSDSLMTLQTSSPLVKVATTGPKSVSVNKVSTYKVNVSNLGSAASGSLLIAIDIPGHVELADADLSTGTPEVEESETSTRVLWTIENVQGQSEENMLVKVVPRQPLPFDLDVEWTFVPFSKGARVQVTEPRLTMDISGPSEVKYGEKAIYTITLNNPGTGNAEDVIVALSETLGGEQAAVGTIEPGDRKQFEVELIARDAGQIDLGATVTADGEIKVPATKPITVRRARLEVVAQAPNYRYAGSDISYQVTIANVGDAVASNVLAAIALPKGAKYLEGIEGAALSETGDALRWSIGTMSSGSEKTYTVRCVLTQPGTARLEAGARGDEQLADSAIASTKVDALADLTMVVVDPRGPQQVGDEVVYHITVENRGTKEATNVKLVGQFSPGIEPTRTEGLKSQIVPGSVAFETIPSIPVGRTVALKVFAKAGDKGIHTFRAELNCVDQDIRRVFEGTTKYFVAPEMQQDQVQRMSESSLDNGFNR